VAYTFDRGNHRQTGEYGYLSSIDGLPENPFSGRNGRPVLTADGKVVQQRDRKSVALLNQVAAQYIGKFIDDRLKLDIGVRAPFFKRDLNQYCYTKKSNGFATCTTQPGGPTPSASFIAPFQASYKYDKLLPNAGVTFKLTDAISAYGSYAKGFSAPRTDNLYRASIVDVKPETTDAFDLGLRYGSRHFSAQIGGWIINYQNRIVSSYNQDLGISLDRNVGKVGTYGIDASLAYQPIEKVTLYTFGSYTHAELKSDIETASNVFAPTKGKMVPETPKWQLGGRAEATIGFVSLGMQAKYVGSRFATDVNDVKVKGYTLVDLDARMTLEPLGLKQTWVQLNISNLFDTYYFGNISTQIDSSGGPSFSVGAPRTAMATLRVGF
jgi:iron complex outermembrane receptor protein